MGFFSFNSEILSLSGTIKTNRGGNAECYQTGINASEPVSVGFPAWASVGAGRGGRGLIWDLPSAPSSTPGQPTGLQTGGRGAGESAPGEESEPPLLLSFGAPKGVQGTRFLEEGRGAKKHPQLCRSPHLLLFFPHLQVSSDIHRSLCRARDKDSWQWESGFPGGWRTGDPNSRREAQERGTRLAIPRPGSCVLPAGKLQRRTARVGHNPRAERPAPLPIPIHPARPVTTSLSLEEV